MLNNAILLFKNTDPEMINELNQPLSASVKKTYHNELHKVHSTLCCFIRSFLLACQCHIFFLGTMHCKISALAVMWMNIAMKFCFVISIFCLPYNQSHVIILTET